MATAETDSEEEFNEERSRDDSSDSDLDKNEIERYFQEDVSLPSYDDSAEMQNVEEIQESFIAWKEVQEELEETCSPQDPGEEQLFTWMYLICNTW